MVFVIAAVGTSGSGKTTTLEYLINHLSVEGYQIGAVKHIHREGFTIDREGTNTWRFAKAGSKIVVAVSPGEIAVIKKTCSAIDDLDQVIDLLEREELDIIFVEGFHSLIVKRADVLKIVTAKDEINLRSTLEQTVEPIIAITGIVAALSPLKFELDIPIINLAEEGEQLLQVVKNCMKN